MPNKHSAIDTLIGTFIYEANSAADMVLLEIDGLSVPNEVLEAVNETKEITSRAALYTKSTISILNELNWQMHITCSKLYLNIQRVERGKRERFSSAINAYKMMMYQFSMGQMQLAPIQPKQFMRDIKRHADILNDSTQKEIKRLTTLYPHVYELTKLLIENNAITSQLAECISHENTEKLASISYDVTVFTNNMSRIAELLDEPGDTLDYLAKEYRFFSGKISEISKQ